ncbi:MAG: sigma-70 family RNA polymerase sigma factor [Deltaproteobacteria bacterium]|nr:sigma-70 family RNA polymerase sigma factor [Deltaproteobacteria bacterium]
MVLSLHREIHRYARRVAYRYADRQCVEDLESIGTLGLLEALSRVSEVREESLESYARLRIQGAMVDALWRDDWVPRSVRRRAREIDGVRSALRQRLGRHPSEEELAEGLGLSGDQLAHARRYAHIPEVISLESYRGESTVRVGDTVADDRPGPEDAAQRARARAVVRAVVASLPQRDRLLVEGYYFRGQSLKDLAQAVNVSESRVSQLLSRARARLREALDMEDLIAA